MLVADGGERMLAENSWEKSGSKQEARIFATQGRPGRLGRLRAAWVRRLKVTQPGSWDDDTWGMMGALDGVYGHAVNKTGSSTKAVTG